MKISVALCTYNGEKFIAEQLNSILNQTVSVNEIIVCDDGSTDDTVNIVNSLLSKAPVVYHIEKNEKSLGVANNFLKALKLATGDYVFTCDQDDVWHKDKVKTFLCEINATKKDLYFSDGILVDAEGVPMGNTLWEAYNIKYDNIIRAPIIKTLVRQSLATGAATVVSKNLINQINAIPANWLHDEWFAVVAALNNSAQPINRTTFNYRQHGKNVVGAEKQTVFQRFKVWLNNYKNLNKIRNINYERMCDVSILAQNTEYFEIIIQAKKFWKSLLNCKNQNRIKSLVAISKLFIQGEYSRFYTGIRGFIRDLISVLFFKKD